MKKRIFSIMMSMGMSLVLFMTGFFGTCYIKADASELSTNGITINSEYLIPDNFDWCTCYVVVATNNTGRDIKISADFVALDQNGDVLSKVNDYSEAVKKDQQFILDSSSTRTSQKLMILNMILESPKLITAHTIRLILIHQVLESA